MFFNASTPWLARMILMYYSDIVKDLCSSDYWLYLVYFYQLFNLGLIDNSENTFRTSQLLLGSTYMI